MYLNSSRFNPALILGVLVGVTMLLGGCAASAPAATPTTLSSPPTPLPPATATPVPIATWVAQGLPEDTVIQYSVEPTWDRGWFISVTIRADGTVSSTIYEAGDPWIRAQGANSISQDELGRIVLEFARIDWFNLGTAWPVRRPALFNRPWDCGRTQADNTDSQADSIIDDADLDADPGSLKHGEKQCPT